MLRSYLSAGGGWNHEKSRTWLTVYRKICWNQGPLRDPLCVGSGASVARFHGRVDVLGPLRVHKAQHTNVRKKRKKRTRYFMSSSTTCHSERNKSTTQALTSTNKRGTSIGRHALGPCTPFVLCA